MRGELCIGSASFFSFVAVLLLIFAHVGSTNHNSVARGISLVNVNVTGYGLALQSATGDPTPGLYNNTWTAPLGQSLGLRQIYRWGFYGHCAYVNASLGLGSCTAEGNGTFGYEFMPLAVILSDTPPPYKQDTEFIVPPSTFKDSIYDGNTSRAGFYIIFIGSLAAVLAFILGLIRHDATFTAALFLSAFATLMIMIGAAIWTALVQKSMSVNNYRVGQNVELGIKVSYGIALWLIWGAFISLFLSIGPYFLSCYSYRRRRND